MKRELRKLVKQPVTVIGGTPRLTRKQIKDRKAKLLNGTIEGTCDWCGKHKVNILGLCPHCYRFPSYSTSR